MTFSVVTPSHNSAHYLPDCIGSVQAQQHVEIEHIVVDAASTDGTVELLQRNPHLHWQSEPDRGISDGINKGFRRASGEWVMWLNADDYLLPGALEKVARFAESHPEADVIYGGWHFVDAARNITRTSRPFPIDKGMMIYYGPYIGSTACFLRRRTTIDEGHLLNVLFRTNMDGEYYARLLTLNKRFVHFPEVLACFRIHGENASMKDRRDKSIDGLLRQERQWAESAAIRRAYGWTPFDHPAADGIVDALLWFFYRAKKVVLKIAHGSYR